MSEGLEKQPDAGVQDIAALLGQVAVAKEQFDDFISSSRLAVSQAVDATKAAGDEAKAKIGSSREVAEAAQNNAEQSADKAKAHLESVNALKVDIATIKGAAEESRKAVSADAAQVSQAKMELEKTHAAVLATSEKV